MTSNITAIATANPDNKISQQQALDFMVKINGLSGEEAHQLKLLYRASGIESRFSVLPDFASNQSNTFFPNNSAAPFPSTSDRMNIYKEEALKLSMKSANLCLKNSTLKTTDITHLITVSCTGLHAPGLDLQLVEMLGLSHNVKRTAVNFMGCYAAFNALKLGDAFCRTKNAKVLIICTELCSIHFQQGKDEDNLLANALFGDGSAAVLMESSTMQSKSLSIDKAHCDILPNGNKEMAWDVGNFGFEMKLSSYVPTIIQNGISSLLQNFNNSFDYYAIHPGGKKILSIIEEALSISKELNQQAHHVLRKYGNMSSPTVLFVLKEIFDGITKEDHDKRILSMAFGPGITLESMTLKINAADA